ncbi:MAG: hypothetical protein AB7F20_13290 [Geoalkalibacter sp.]|jgi:hypothetical protein|uniref:hypothetical protein n=1 Tax=Geoalkalibacter sp. TaxID=3041440 RepID=UPI002A950B54|nr:hypothetical protein [Thermodesulfobacteriota bacterium]
MMIRRKAIGTAIFICSTLLVLLSGCSGVTGKMSGAGGPPQKMYIDATRHFAVEFPGDWEKFLDPDSDTLPGADAVGWQSPETEGSAPVARMAVIIPHENLDFSQTKAAIARHLDGFTPGKEADIEVAGLRGKDLYGTNPLRQYRIVLLGDPFVRYVILYSALPDYFETYQDKFKDMIKSFGTLR